jgi:hypothetical protein
MRQEGTIDPEIDSQRGDLVEVEEAIKECEAGEGNLNSYRVKTATDSYTLLLLACINEHMDAVQRLLILGRGHVDINKVGSFIRVAL